MRIGFLLGFFLLLTACLSNNTLETHAIAENNIYRLRQLCVGMSEDEVFVRMRAPVKEEQVVIENDQYDIWFYITKRTSLDQDHLMRRNLTPLIFKNERLIGSGYTLYDRVIYLAAIPSDLVPPPNENRNLEKSLNRKSIPQAQKVSLNQKQEDPDEKTPDFDEDEQRMLRQEREEDFNER
jgi:hypothetical protein